GISRVPVSSHKAASTVFESTRNRGIPAGDSDNSGFDLEPRSMYLLVEDAAL
ncbi:hypothetical protein B296_00029811, partial [Ensete ventricosum]